jgi:guanylate kinase
MFGKSYPDSVGILILPPSFTVLEERLRARKTESEADLKIRLENARKEIETAVSSKGYAYTIINDELGKACNEIVGTVKSITGVK